MLFDTIDNDQKRLVYMCCCDEISSILKSRSIKKEKYVSFSRGMPIVLKHGDTAIVFNRSKLENKGCKFTDIEYTKEFFDKYPYLKEHVAGEDFNKEYIMKEIEKNIDILQETPFSEDSKSAIIKFMESQKDGYDNHYEDSFLYATWVEKESVLCNSCFNFEIDDIDAIISISRTIHIYYPLPSEYISKIIYIEDYMPASFIINSPLHDYWDDIGEYYETVKRSVPSLDEYFTKMFHYTYLLATNINVRLMAVFQPKPIVDLSQSIYEKSIFLLPELNNMDKIFIVDVLRRKLLYGTEHSWLEGQCKKIIHNYVTESN